MSTTARIKRQLAVYGGTLGAVAVVFALVAAGGAGYLYLNPPTEVDPPEELSVQQFGMAVEHSAVVTNGSALYEENDVLRNQPVYFTNSTPTLQLSFLARTPQNRPVDVSRELVVHHRAEFEGDTFWENRTVHIDDRRALRNGRSWINITLSIPQIRDRRTDALAEIGTVGSISSEIRARLTYDSPTDGATNYTGSLSASTPLQFSENAYWLGNNLSASETERKLGPRTVTQLSPDYVLIGGLGLSSLLLLAFGAGVLLWSSRYAESYELDVNVYRDKYDEWISEGEFPTDATNKYVYINSIVDLVDVAIDTNKRVIYDPDLETFSVMDGDVVYYYGEDPRTLNSWLEFSANE